MRRLFDRFRRVHLPPDNETQPAVPPEDMRIDDLRDQFVAHIFDGARVLEIGSRARSGNSYRDLFPADCRYIGLDVCSGPNVDVVGDAHDLRRSITENVDFIFSVSTFEHLIMPWVAALEMNHVLNDGGLAFVQSHQAWPVHEEPWDFWRFSDNAWRALFNAHTGFEVIGAEYQHRALVASHVDIGPPVHGLEFEPAWLLSACLIRKIGNPKVSWDARVSDIYNLEYSHGMAE